MHLHAATSSTVHRVMRVSVLIVVSLLICLAAATSAHASGATTIGGTGSQNDPFIIALNRPEAADGINRPNSSKCWGKRGTNYQDMGNLMWHPVHDSVVTCDSVFGATYVQIDADDEFTDGLGNRVGLTECYATGALVPCTLYKVETGLSYTAFMSFTQKLHASLSLDAGVYRIGSFYYTYVWGPPTFMCTWPQTLSVRSISCDLSGLQVTAAPSYTYFG